MSDNLSIPTLHHSKTSVCSQKVRLVLDELNINWRGVVLDLKGGDQFSDSHLRLNPSASVPVYVDRSLVLTESNDIMLHLSRSCCEENFLKIAPQTENKVHLWLEESIRFHTAVHVLTTLALNRLKLLELNAHDLGSKLNRIPDAARAQRIYDVVQNGAWGNAATSAIIYTKNIYRKLNTELTQNKYLCGESMTLADLAILPFVLRIDFLDLKPDWSEASYDQLDRWVETLSQRPSFESAIMSFHGSDIIKKYQQAGFKVRNNFILKG